MRLWVRKRISSSVVHRQSCEDIQISQLLQYNSDFVQHMEKAVLIPKEGILFLSGNLFLEIFSLSNLFFCLPKAADPRPYLPTEMKVMKL